MDYSEKWGRDTDEAVKLALDDLGLTIDEVEVTVLEEPSRGFFGIGSKLAKVRVEKKRPPEKEETHKQTRPDLVIPIEEARARDAANRERMAAEGKSAEEPREPRREKRPKNGNKKNNRKEHSDRSGNAGRSEKMPAGGQEPKAPIIAPEPEENLQVLEDHPAMSFLRDLIREMGLEAEVTGKIGEETIYLDIQGKDSGTIIGKRGQTLDAVQYLTSLVVNKDQNKYTRVVVDAENYRAKRERTLEALSYRLANKVVKSRRPVRLEPMNPYERKVIHATLQSHPKVTTRSEGEDPYRRVVIELK